MMSKEEARRLRELTFYDFLILRFLKKHPGSTILNLLGPIPLGGYDIERLMRGLTKKGLVVSGRSFDANNINRKVFYLVQPASSVLECANKLLRTRWSEKKMQ